METEAAVKSIPLEKKRAFLINLGFYLSLFAILWFVISYGIPWMMPFLIAYFVAVMAEPLVSFMTRYLHLKRGFASPVALLLLFALISWLLIIIFSRLAYESATFLENWAGLYALIREKFAGFELLLNDWFELLPPYVIAYVDRMLASLVEGLPSLIGSLGMSVMTAATGIATKLPSALIVSLVVLAACLLFSIDFHALRDFLRLQVPTSAQGAVTEAASFFKLTVLRFLRAYSLICLITFVELVIGFHLIGVDYSVTLSAIIALVDVLPIVGCGTVLVPWGIIAIMFGNMRLGVCLLILCAVITAVRQFLEPKIVGSSIGLHPIATLISIYAGLNFFGIFGMFLLPIALIVLKHLQDNGYISLWNSPSKS